jgi:hypothetical protein
MVGFMLLLFTPSETAPVSTRYEVVGAAEPVYMLWRREKSCPSQEMKPSNAAHSPFLSGSII